MNHPGEQDLILYFYEESADAWAIEEHLASCPACRVEYESLRGVLAAVSAMPAPERARDYGALIWNRIRGRLPRRRLVGFPRQWLWTGAIAAMLVLAFLAGRQWQRPARPLPISAQARERILLVAVGDHLERSQMVLAELANAPVNGGVDITVEQRRAEDLLESNRLFRQAAAGAGEAAMAGLLDELERVLLEVVHSPAKLSRPQIEGIRSRLDRQEILFKVRVVGALLRAREQAAERAQGRGES